MKLVIAFVILIIGHNNIKCQTAFDSNFVWTEVFYDSFSPLKTSRKVTISSHPTIINNLTYYALLMTDSFDGVQWDTTNTYFRTANKKVYMKWPDKEVLLYDFAAEIGETFLTSLDVKLEVIMTDSVVIANGGARKRLILSCVWNESLEQVHWIEGVGSNMGFTQNVVCQFDWYVTSLCTYYKGDLLYKNPDVDTCWLVITSNTEPYPSTIAVFPNPANNSLNISDLGLKVTTTNILDLFGNILKSESKQEIDISMLPAGSYLIQFLLEDGGKFCRRFIKIE